MNTRWFCVLAAAIIFVPLQACTEAGPGRTETSFEKQPGITEIKPQRPVKIKLKRSTTGKYSWDLRGDDAEKILEADSMLREGLDN